MSVIGEAFVRVRPDTAGFKQETESSVRAAVAGVGKIIAGAFAIKGTFDFGKEIVTHAADVQKQVEAIKSEFGDAAEAVLEFGEHGAAALGVSAHLADTTAARFGIIGRNLGLTSDQTGALTIGFEKIAGSISQIRNVDPERVFATLPLAIQGNLRSLKQLGIATDQNQLKIAAFKLGLTDTVSQALTPGQRALAIYAVATANLGEFQAQATSHAGDLANVQRRLSAEWDNSKDSLGRGLLPAMEKVFGFLADTLPGAVDRTTHGFRTLKDDVDEITGPIGGLKGAVEGLVGAFAVGKIVAFASAIRTDLIANGFAELQVATKAEQVAYIEAFGSMEIATLGLSATIKSALISTGIGAIAVAIGISAELVINHWSKVKKFFEEWADGLIYLFKRVVGAIGTVFAFIPHFVDPALHNLGERMKAWAKTTGTDVGDQLNASIAAALAANDAGHPTKALAGLAKEGFTTDLLTGDTITDKGKLQTSADSASAATRAALARLNAQLQRSVAANVAGISDARTQLGNARQSLADAIRQEGTDVSQAVQQAKDNLVSLGTGLASTVGEFIDKGPLGQLITRLQNALAGRQQDEQRKQLIAAVAAAKKTLAESLDAVDTGGPVDANTRRGINQFLAPSRQSLAQAQGALKDFNAQNRITGLQARAQALKDSITRGVADLTDAFNHGGISPAEFNARVSALLARGGITYKRAGKVLGTSFADGFRDQVTTILQQAFAINAGPQLAGISGTVIRPLEVLRTDQNRVAQAQHQVALKQTGLQERIARAAEKTADQIAKIKSVQLGPTADDVRPAAAPAKKPRR